MLEFVFYGNSRNVIIFHEQCKVEHHVCEKNCIRILQGDLCSALLKVQIKLLDIRVGEFFASTLPSTEDFFVWSL